MRWVRSPSLAALLIASLAGGCAQGGTPESTPAGVVQGLYSALETGKVTGAPAPEELTALTPYLSEELVMLLRRARALHDADVARAPDEKPAFAEGDLFSSLFEGTTSLEVVGDSLAGTEHRLEVRFTYAGTPPAIHWTDHIMVIQEKGKFVVADVQYGGGWDFGNKGSLVASLKEALPH